MNSAEKVQVEQSPASTVMIAAGGTGGHVFPALAVCERLLGDRVPVIWIGTARGLEARVVPEQGIPFFEIEVSGFRGKNVMQRIVAPVKLLRSLWRVSALIRRHNVSVVLGFGGYVSAAAGFSSLLTGKTLLLQEQNAIPGTSNRLLARFAKRVFTGFPSVLTAAGNTEHSGNPVRESIVTASIARRIKRHEQDQSCVSTLRLVIIGGSLGALPINEVMPAALKELGALLAENSAQGGTATALSVLHQTGRGNLAAVEYSYAQMNIGSASEGVKIKRCEFINNMDAVLGEADLVVARAGALTVSELLVMGVPAIFIPLPHAIDDHQTENAQFVVSKGAAELLAQRELTAVKLGKLLFDLLVDPDRLRRMGEEALKLARTDASDIVASACREFAL